MKNILKIKHSQLTPERFQEYPVWAWTEDFDEEDLVSPVVETEPLPSGLSALFIKADFWAPTKLHFDGYVVADIEIYCVDLFVGSRRFGFNVRLRDLAEQALQKLRQTIMDEHAQIFPLRYKTNFRFANGEHVEGIFDPFRGK
jgi:hypothetical protein